MKRYNTKRPTQLSLSALSLALVSALGSAASAGETIVWDGNSPATILKTINFVNKSLGPKDLINSIDGNNITVNDTTGTKPIKADVYGAYSYGKGTSTPPENVTNNTVTIQSGKIIRGTVTVAGVVYPDKGGYVYGGYARDGAALKNRTIINGGEIEVGAYGGRSHDFDASENTLKMTGGAINTFDAIGGSSEKGHTDKNIVTIVDGAIKRGVTGGYTVEGNARDNVVTINGGTIGEDVMGGDAARQLVYTHKSTVNYDSYTINNTVNINGGIIGGNVYGGHSGGNNEFGKDENNKPAKLHADFSNNNKVNITKGSITGSVIGGYTQLTTSQSQTNNNVINISGGTVRGAVWGGLDFSTSNPNNLNESKENKVSISDGAVTGRVYGGYSNLGNAIGNTLTITGGTLDSSVYGGNIANGTENKAELNKVEVSGGEVKGSVYGGFSESDGIKSNTISNSVLISDKANVQKVYGGLSNLGNATDNNVTITGGTINSSVYGGLARNGTAGTQIAQNNTIRIENTPVFNTDPTKGTVLYGGMVGDGTSYAPTTTLAGAEERATKGNKLEIYRTKDITVNNIKNFEHLHFYLPEKTVAGDTILKLTGSGADITGAKVAVSFKGNDDPLLKPKERITIINAEQGLKSDAANKVNHIAALQGVSTLYNLSLNTDPNNLYLEVKEDGKLNPATKSFLEDGIAALAHINQGGDMATGAWLDDALESKNGLFGIISGQSSRYKTGSHVDTQGVSLISGANHNRTNTAGAFNARGFFEAGWANYDSFNSFVNAPNVRASGDTRYYGLGVYAKQSLKDNGVYLEGSLRGGKIESNYKSADIVDGENNPASFKGKRNYYGMHIAAGRIWDINPSGKLNAYAKLFYARLSGNNQVISNETYTFAALTSLRSRLGARYTHNVKEGLKTYAGLAWEKKYKGDARGSVKQFAIDAPSLKGNTAIAELGISFVPENNKKLSLDFGVKGYAGQRKGASANAEMSYRF